MNATGFRHLAFFVQFELFLFVPFKKGHNGIHLSAAPPPDLIFEPVAPSRTSGYGESSPPRSRYPEQVRNHALCLLSPAEAGGCLHRAPPESRSCYGRRGPVTARL